ncbi:RNA polymerase subunit sigma-24 [Caulobacter sp. CCUG 60055]|uniref:RNA polymerase sigma factor n=1 Tax=Caulobacter sp. CCUG 60055 TaxID=2100090 RepID=UPI001FA79D74|nr:RNA polymerase sigma factor [Caulobacter sp. CCUG 60055]MBQ1542530.1 RNA polymerase sigma factor [Caulobacteraceae bacterium]MCI3180400.1 RNA polymerase subunit sigma-24 [Caulobacter sp. CCUG 60055]
MSWLRDIDRWFGAAVLPHAPMFRAYARRLVGDDGDDLVQEAYARVFGLEDWRRLDAPDRFVLRVIRNLALERFRRAKVVPMRRLEDVEMNALPDVQPDAYAVTSAREDLSRVAEALARLPDQCRKVVILRKLEGLSPREIAVRLNLSVSTVEKHLAKGLRLLTQTLADDAGTKVRSGSWVANTRKIARN